MQIGDWLGNDVNKRWLEDQGVNSLSLSLILTLDSIDRRGPVLQRMTHSSVSLSISHVRHICCVANFSGGFLQAAQTWANVGVCSASCAHALGSMFVCLFVCLFILQAIWVIVCREGHDSCLKSYGVFYFSNVWWDYIPDANCSGVKRTLQC